MFHVIFMNLFGATSQCEAETICGRQLALRPSLPFSVCSSRKVIARLLHGVAICNARPSFKRRCTLERDGERGLDGLF